MASICWASVKGLAMRATALDNCCRPVDNTCGVVVTDGFVSAVVTQNVSEGTDIELRNAADKVCVYSAGCDELLELQVVLTLCKVNPELVSLMTGSTLVLNGAGVAVGFRRRGTVDCDRRFALEIWSEVPGVACVGTPAQRQWGYYLLPCMSNAQITGEVTIDAGNAVTTEITAVTKIPSLWGTGPENGTDPAANFDVIHTDAAATIAGHLLTPIADDEHDNIQLTTVPPPTVPAECGCVPLDNQVV
jgi:hypothetical protein